MFGVNDAYFATEYPENIEDFSAHGGDDSDAGCWIKTWGNEALNPAIKEFQGKFSAAEAVLETLGDHAHVTVTHRADGVQIEVDEYSHD